MFTPTFQRNGILYPQWLPPVRKRTNKPLTLSEEMAADIARRLERLIEEEKPYLRTSYSLLDMANDIKAPQYLLSYYLNQHLGIRYNDYINKYRVQHFIEMVKNGALYSFTMSGIAIHCGFNNRNSLGTAFKRVTGITPSDYVRSQANY